LPRKTRLKTLTGKKGYRWYGRGVPTTALISTPPASTWHAGRWRSAWELEHRHDCDKLAC
jgi:hypothetical protein